MNHELRSNVIYTQISKYIPQRKNENQSGNQECKVNFEGVLLKAMSQLLQDREGQNQ